MKRRSDGRRVGAVALGGSTDRQWAMTPRPPRERITWRPWEPPAARPSIRRETESSELCVKNEMALAGLQPLRALRVIRLFHTSSPMYCRKRHFTPRRASTSKLPEVGRSELVTLSDRLQKQYDGQM